MVDDKYVKQLEDVIKKMLAPLKDIPLKIVIKSLSGYDIIDFDNNDPADRELLDCLINACKNAMQSINLDGINTARPNEAGNAVEQYVKNELTKLGCNARTPSMASGKEKSSGYPDIVFTDLSGRDNYLECKTFNENTLKSSLRTFYLSPSKDFKVTSNAHHFLVSFEMEKRQSNFYVKGFKLLTLEKLNVDVKNEFNANNKELYKAENILFEYP
ncbi:MAG: restriction endonuclease [Caldisphaera sp.]